MTTTETLGSPMTPPRPTHRLRRSRTDRIGAGVAGGLGEYFGIDPVIFRVLFATAAFFGGAGVLGYLVAWAAIPEEGTEHAPIDGWVTALRQRRVPVWVIAVAAGALLWLAAFSWWAPGRFFPILAVVIILVAIFGRRGDGRATPPPPPVQLTKDVAGPAEPDRPAAAPWRAEAARWVAESRAARRERLRRAFPVKLATLVALGGALLTIGLIDAAHGVAVPLYFWFATAILGAGLLVGMALRRTPWSMVVLFVPAAVGLIALAGSHASLHDGVGQRVWTPTHNLAKDYDLAFGRATLDLSSLDPQSGPRAVHIEQAAGQVRVIAPRSLNLTIIANVHFGDVSVDGTTSDQSSGVGVSRIVEPLPGAAGQPITVRIHLADGHVSVDRH
ncbi:MAG TPA: PspC domain-containing protein [Jatrophihabitans sp.]|jgi:phage shock protein PspC (stress-responsive transcriptional regulator)